MWVRECYIYNGKSYPLVEHRKGTTIPFVFTYKNGQFTINTQDIMPSFLFSSCVCNNDSCVASLSARGTSRSTNSYLYHTYIINVEIISPN